jgi:hypothetical protein
MVAASVIAVLAVGIPVALTRGGDPAGSRNISDTPSATVEPTPTVVTYPGAGVQVTSIADVSKLDGTTGAFKDFIADVWRDDARSGCPTPTVTVQGYRSDGFARGGVGGCGGYQALWVDTDAHWREALATQDEWRCGDLARFEVPDGFAGDCYGSSALFGPETVAGLRIRMTAQQVTAAGGTLEDPETDTCTNVTLPVEAGEAASAHGVFSRARGLVAFFAEKDVLTPKGIGLGSTKADVQAAYPHGHLSNGYWTVALSSDVEYEFGFEADGTVGELVLTDPDQDCFG